MTKKFRTGDNKQGLIDLIEFCKPKFVLELGVANGESTEIFLDAGCKVVAIDYRTEEYAPEFDKRIGNRVFVYEGLTKNVLLTEMRLCANAFDLVYIDADHRMPHTLADMCLTWPLVNQSGYIGGHDYKMEGVNLAVDYLFGSPDQTFIDSSWIVCKRRFIK